MIENSDACFPNFGAARTPYLMYDVYTNVSLVHGMCFPTVLTNCIYTCINAKECLTNAVANFTNALRMKQQHDACVLYAYTVLPVFLLFLHLPAPAK